ncbi:cobaltochelatase subunit CobN [Teredinibacter turnerae]|uniref:cobaltochelatase subunit CobN n=1 Tax=Teredinibacter turnerae TaxID=2426 RepID=UPI000361670D|nr:cobaltochelatase subunit CobN [Teredinibacter turnerae]
MKVSVWVCSLWLLVGVCCTQAASADYLLLISSQRNAETLAEAVRLFRKSHPELAVQARTDEQLREYTASELDALFRSANGVFATGLYGGSVAQLSPYFARGSLNQLIVSSDHRLVAFSRIRQRALFATGAGSRRVAESATSATATPTTSATLAITTNTTLLATLAKSSPEGDLNAWLKSMRAQYPAQRAWLEARAYWQVGGASNTTALISYLYHNLAGAAVEVAAPENLAPVRWFHNGGYRADFPTVGSQPVIAVIDHAGGAREADSHVLSAICEQAVNTLNHQCVAAVANWGAAGVDALSALLPIKHQLTAIIMLQDFVVGGGEGRLDATALFSTLNVPVLKGIKLRDRSQQEYALSADGLAREKVYYQVAMPELQGASQPLVVATAGDVTTDALSGIRIHPITPEQSGINALLERIGNWHKLQTIPNKEKRVAIIYYNHPPGRHNIGADNLDVPASLWQILQQMKRAGYNTGDLPQSPEALLDLLQRKGVNLPRDAKTLRTMADKVATMAPAAYAGWFNQLPATLQQEMRLGPLGLLHQQLVDAIEHNATDLGRGLLSQTVGETRHLLEGVDHPGRSRAMALLGDIEHCYEAALATKKMSCFPQALSNIQALRQTGIEGLGGWGQLPGKVMVVGERILLPGIQFGNIFVGPQPPRGWEINEELLHANLAFPPPHQYLAFYHFLKSEFRADALIHLGRHSTYEFLPRRAVGVGPDDYSRITAGDLPGIYPYIVDGVGEGIQAKRRGLAVMVDHLTPPLKRTDLYDELLQLRQLVESFESQHGSEDSAVSERLIQQIRQKIVALNLTDELVESMSAELAVMGIGFTEVDDEMLVHEIGHYLTNLQEKFMPLGLHVYGKPWQENAVAMMLDSMGPTTTAENKQWRALLEASPAAEMQALLAGLNGRYISPGPGNDPIRSPESLPTGRNFFALDSSLIPSRAAWALGQEMAAQARRDNPQSAEKSSALVLWASDVVRDEGVMIAFGLDLLGVEPQWNSRGLVTGLRQQERANGNPRRDVVFTTSGLFRDLYAMQLELLNRAALMALDASRDRIVRDFPALTVPLQNALQPLQAHNQHGDESLQTNQVAAHWVAQAKALLADGVSAEQAGAMASYRVFGDAPGSYGAGINRMAERSGAWESRDELADVYLRRLGHSYGGDNYGVPAQRAFKMQLANVENTYFGRASNLYGLLDNNDAFDYLGGLSLAVETLSGQAPSNYVIDHSDPQAFKTQPLKLALRQELRSRFLNPQWLEGLMVHGYAGARTMGSEFFEYLWGWQITNPTLVGDWAWDEVKSVYIDDKYQLGLDTFLGQGHNVHVKTNMLAIMLVAIQKGFWQADAATRKSLASEFANLVAEHGLPGSGHTDPDHPMLTWLQSELSPAQREALANVVRDARPAPEQALEIHRLSELQLEASDSEAADEISRTVENQNKPTSSQAAVKNSSGASVEQKQSSASNVIRNLYLLALFLFAVATVAFASVRAVQNARKGSE